MMEETGLIGVGAIAPVLSAVAAVDASFPDNFSDAVERPPSFKSRRFYCF
jgi:hypothetical protein